MDGLVKLLLEAPDTQMDSNLKKSIEQWTTPEPKSIEVLKTLDECVYSSQGSGFVVMALETVFKSCCLNENVSEEEIISQATWRK